MLKLGTQTGSLVNHLYSTAANKPIAVGDGATILHWTDRTACTVISVSPKTIVLQEDKSTRTDKFGMSDQQEYGYTPNVKGAKSTFTLRKNGKWIKLGDSMKGTQCIIGKRDQYYDYSF